MPAPTWSVVLVLALASSIYGWWRTHRRLMEARTHEVAQERVHAAIEERVRIAERVARFGTWSWDRDSDVVTLSGGAAEISGLGADALTVGLDALLATVHPDDRAAMSEARAISC